MVGAINMKPLARAGQATRVVSVVAAVPIMACLQPQGLADQRACLADGFDSMAHAFVAAFLASRLGGGTNGRSDCR